MNREELTQVHNKMLARRQIAKERAIEHKENLLDIHGKIVIALEHANKALDAVYIAANKDHYGECTLARPFDLLNDVIQRLSSNESSLRYKIDHYK